MRLYGSLTLICWMLFMASAVWGLTIQYKIAHAVRTQVPGQKPLPRLKLWREIMTFRVWFPYRSYFPEGKLLRKYWRVEMASFALFVLAIVCGFLVLHQAVR